MNEQQMIQVTKGDEVLYQQAEVGPENTRRAIDFLFTAPSGDDLTVRIVSSGKSLSFSTGSFDVSDLARIYNGARAVANREAKKTAKKTAKTK